MNTNSSNSIFDNETNSLSKCNIKLVAEVIALATYLSDQEDRELRLAHVWPVDPERTMFRIKWSQGFLKTLCVSPATGTVLKQEFDGKDFFNVLLTEKDAYVALMDTRRDLELLAVDAEVRLMETQAQLERTTKARQSLREKLLNQLQNF